MNRQANPDLDVIVLAPFGKDAQLIEKVLCSSGTDVRTVSRVREIVDLVPESGGVAIISEEALAVDEIRLLAEKIDGQPAWSDFPLIVLTGGGMSTAATENAVRSRAPLGNVTLLERPLRAATMVSIVRSSLTARRRQYEIRDHLRERKLAEEALRQARDTLEVIVEQRTAALRQLSTKLLRAQDEERRRIARELHDSLGQYLAAAKINLDTLSFTLDNRREDLADIQDLIDRAIGETRTLSHLLHPPLLDAAGFASAANWYVAGFGKRSGIQTSLVIPEDLPRLPSSVETALFRIMQEALTNVHRHAKSPAVHITLGTDANSANLTIRDFGTGIPKEVLDRFAQSGTNVGVGLAGIRERVKELGGNIEIHSGDSGTVLRASIPVAEPPVDFFADGGASQAISPLVS